MATSRFLLRVLLVICCFSSLPGSLGVSYTVGGSSGWTIPSASSLEYETWASSHTFYVGDSLVFNYDSEFHSVLQVTHSSYKECNVTSPLSTSSDGKTIINLAHRGSHYFICGVPGHCQAGQKVQLKAVDATGHVEASQAALAKRNDAAFAPAPAPGLALAPAPTPSSKSAPSLSQPKTMMKMVFVSLINYALFHSTNLHTAA